MITKPQILGVSKRYYPMQSAICGDAKHRHDIADQCEDPPVTLVVLVAGEIGDYAAYAGHGSPNWVADHGDKISFEEASAHFPNSLKREAYRV